VKAGDDGNLCMIDLGQARTIDEQIGRWRNNITQQFPGSNRGGKVASRDLKFDQDGNHATLSSEEYLELSNQLAKVIVNNAELNKFLGTNVNQVWLCPEAAMARMPWDALSTICGIENFKICEIDSPREFVQTMANHSEPKSGEHLLLAGVSNFHDSEFNDLPGTQKEINGIEAEAERAGISYERLLDDQATKTNVRSKIEAATAVHFSTHGFAREDKSAGTNIGAKGNVYFGLMSMTPSIARNPLTDSGLVLSPGLNSSSPPNTDEKPLLTATSDSGPKWRGTSESQTNKKELANLLTAEEIVGLNLRNCKLVSLSACKTGLGTGLDGQGVLGLRSAIMAAGARSILMSLWSVDDDATEELMKKFYSYLLDPQAPVSEVEALRKAQDYIRAQPQWQSPNYWAGWVIAGDGWQTIRACH
jgi:CHAT domain-containing protein